MFFIVTRNWDIANDHLCTFSFLQQRTSIIYLQETLWQKNDEGHFSNECISTRKANFCMHVFAKFQQFMTIYKKVIFD